MKQAYDPEKVIAAVAEHLCQAGVQPDMNQALPVRRREVPQRTVRAGVPGRDGSLPGMSWRLGFTARCSDRAD